MLTDYCLLFCLWFLSDPGVFRDATIVLLEICPDPGLSKAIVVFPSSSVPFKAYAAQAARAAAPPPARQSRPQRTSVAVDPSEVLHQSGVAMVNGALGPLTAAEAQDFNAIVGEFGASHGGI